MSLVEPDDVPDTRSACSTSRTRKPRPAASRAIGAVDATRPRGEIEVGQSWTMSADSLLAVWRSKAGSQMRLAGRAGGDDDSADRRDRWTIATAMSSLPAEPALGTAMVSALIRPALSVRHCINAAEAQLRSAIMRRSARRRHRADPEAAEPGRRCLTCGRRSISPAVSPWHRSGSNEIGFTQVT